MPTWEKNDAQTPVAAVRVRAIVAFARPIPDADRVRNHPPKSVIMLLRNSSLPPIAPAAPGTVFDCLQRVQMPLARNAVRPKLCVATICSPGYENHVADLFSTLREFGNLPLAAPVCVVVDDNGQCEARLAPLGIERVHVSTVGKMRRQINASIKGALYSLPHAYQADYYLCFDSDILVSGDLAPLWSALQTARDGAILAVQGASDMAGDEPRNIEYATWVNYSTHWLDVLKVIGHDPGLNARFVRLNSGMFGGSARALLAVDAELRRMGGRAIEFIDREGAHVASDELLWSFAIARLGCVVEVNEIYNLQMFARDASLELPSPVSGTRTGWESYDARAMSNGGRPIAWFGDQHARVLHFAAPAGRRKMARFHAAFCPASGTHIVPSTGAY